MKIAVTGATGFIGSYMIKYLLEQTNHEIVAVSRGAGQSQHPRLTVAQCDLYLKDEIDLALEGCDMAVYLVHSMSKSHSRLVQGDFQDFDFLLADNFARSAKKNNLRQIVYVTGLLPTEESPEISDHLASRYEVERVLHDQAVPVTALRCGLVIGKNGSSFRIVEKLVRRLPLMLLPVWMDNKTQAVAIQNVVELIRACLENPSSSNRSYDVASPEVLTYGQIVEQTARALSKSPKALRIPWIPVAFSKFWVSLISGVPKELVYPLVESLVHRLIANPKRRPPPNLIQSYTSIDEAIDLSLKSGEDYKLPIQWRRTNIERNQVQSVQRLLFPGSWTIDQLAKDYYFWLPRFFQSLILVDTTGSVLIFYFLSKRIPLLELRLREDQTFNGRQRFDIIGGWLAGYARNGWLEFREGLRHKFAIAAIIRYQPRLPWYFYILFQAKMHAWVMSKFSQHLLRRTEKETLLNLPKQSSE